MNLKGALTVETAPLNIVWLFVFVVTSQEKLKQHVKDARLKDMNDLCDLFLKT